MTLPVVPVAKSSCFEQGSPVEFYPVEKVSFFVIVRD